MSSYNFADRYKSAGLAPGNDVIVLRQVPFEKLRKNADISVILDLSRLYYGLPLPGGAEWFREAFAENDLGFSMIDNEREASVLAACLLGAIIDDGNIYAAIAPLVAGAGGARTPLSNDDFIEHARQAIAKHSVASRRLSSADPSKIKQPVKGKAFTTIDGVIDEPELTALAEAVKALATDSLEATKALSNQISSVIKPVVEQVRDLREEVDMLWWYVGGWSRILEKPFAELDIGTAALMAGLDLSHLVKGESGPVAAPAILHRLIVSQRSEGKTPLPLDLAIDTIPAGTLSNFAFNSKIAEVADLCPILCALMKAEDIGTGSSWHAAFKKTTALEATIEFQPLELAMQVYREALLMSQVG